MLSAVKPAADPTASTVNTPLWVSAFILGNVLAFFWLLQFALRTRNASLVVLTVLLRIKLKLSKNAGTISTNQGIKTSEAPAAGAELTTAVKSILRRHSKLVSPATLHWEDLGCSYQSSHGLRKVLSQVSGHAAPGTLHALLGPSGAGKSTLLDILARRKQVGQITGQVLLDGKQATIKDMAAKSAYVPQDDNFMATMTALETLSFFAALVLPPRLSRAAATARCMEVLKVVGLEHTAHTLVGGYLAGGYTLRGMSGGERRRLGFAVGLLAAPSLLFLDEPTSGLDSAAALTVCKYMRTMADGAGHVIVASIHQPRSAIWACFDAVTLLSKGLMMYSGPADGMVPWFTDHVHNHLPQVSASTCTTRDPEHTPSTVDTHQVLQVVVGWDSPSNHDDHDDDDDDDEALEGAAQADVCIPKFMYDPAVHGVAPDWVMDLVAVTTTYSSEYDDGLHGCNSGHSSTDIPASVQAYHHHNQEHQLDRVNRVEHETEGFQTLAQLQVAAAAFSRYQADQLLASRPSQQCTDTSRTMSSLKVFRKCHEQAVCHTPAPVSDCAAVDDDAHMLHKFEHLYGCSDTDDTSSTTAPEDVASTASTSTDPSRPAQSMIQMNTMSRQEHGSAPVHINITADSASTYTRHQQSGMTVVSTHVDCTKGKFSSDTNFRCADSCPQQHAVMAQQHVDMVVEASQRRRTASPSPHVPMSMARFWKHFKILLWREVLCVTRNPADIAGRLLTFTWIGLFTGLVFYSLPRAAESMQLRLNTHFANTSFFMFMPFISMSLYTSDRKFYLADMSARLYKQHTYYLAKVAATLPFNLLCAIIHCLILHGMAGTRHGVVPEVQLTALACMVSLIAVQVLHMAAIIAPNADLAFMLAIGWTAINLLMSGFFITYQQFAFGWLSQLHWISAQGYAFEGMAVSELAGAAFDCSRGLDDRAISLVPSLLPNTPIAASPLFKAALQNPGPGCVARADAVLEYFGMRRGFTPTMGILVGYWICLHGLTYLALLVASRSERR